ncbi:uncharacterized protein [Cicer arietinum]|uniref:Uncharacterized protein LOC101501163 n=1 Tax=Cicer arietinum TaxID=3827 RepID=A0A1S2XX39_CICAR|nr:uncharacterized protein LOC101501163 [Cicer arietinum]
MDSKFNKSLLVILSLFSLLLSSNAVPSTRLFDFISSSAYAPAPSPVNDFISTSISAETPNSGGDLLETFTSQAVKKTPETKFGGANLLGTFNPLSAEAAKQVDPEIVKLCIDGENPALCAETISKLLDGPFDPLKALEIEVGATHDQAKAVESTITKLLKDPSTDKKAIDALDICKSQYGNMLDAIKESVKLLEEQNVVDAYYKFNAVISYRSACEDAFVESPGVEMPFSQDSQALFDLGGNCLGIMNALVNNIKL